jgi:Sec-independent protein translocase protein TatA
MGPSTIQLIIVGLIALILFNGRELPALLGGLGKGLASLRRELKPDTKEIAP